MAWDWQFWIDVGGTFTDCIAVRPDGQCVFHKLLSSSVYRGNAEAFPEANSLCDSGRKIDPEGFFQGFTLTILRENEWGGNERGTAAESAAGNDLETRTVTGFDAESGTLTFDRPFETRPGRGARYELRSPFSAPTTGIYWLLKKRPGEATGGISVRLGTTKGTNALLERQGARTALVATEGFGDVLRIAYQNRPRLFDLEVRLPEPLYEAAVEVSERLAADGSVILGLDRLQARQQLTHLREQGIEALAVALLHSHRNPEHEQAIRNLALELGFRQISLSSELSPLPKIVFRGDTAVVDAYLTPVIREYIDTISSEIPEASLRLMTSAGSLVSAKAFVGKDSILSGPAGGVVGAAFTGRLAGAERVIGFDMGGTSTDVCRFDGEYERRYEMELADQDTGGAIRIVAPMLSVETVAAGGGSVCWFDGQKPRVGPRSAGADPGPACYGRNGPLTLTDINVFLGRVRPEFFPFPLDREAVEERLDELLKAIRRNTGREYARDELAEGFAEIANANMAAPIKRISLARGYDVRQYALVSFGGAGAQHACAIARSLGIRKIICGAHAGILSAAGIGRAGIVRFAERTVELELDEFLDESSEPHPGKVFSRMLGELREELEGEGIGASRIEPPRRRLDLRYFGQETRMTVAEPDDGDYRRAFEAQHQQVYGFCFPDRPIEVYAARMELAGGADPPDPPRLEASPHTPAPASHCRTLFAGKWIHTALHEREALKPGAIVEGPAIVTEAISTLVIEPGWRAELNAYNDFILTRTSPENERDSKSNTFSPAAVRQPPDPIELELFNNHFASIAEQMGTTLQKTALSTNVKERLDFSCAIFTAHGDLVVNAPHIPVHLGAMSECVRCLLEDVDEFRPGDVRVTNDPYRGGSHLPDVTVITPVFAQGAGAGPAFFVASRAHHAEIGGVTPGSMPPFSRNLAEEGVLIRSFLLARGERSFEDELRKHLETAPCPSRSVGENIADINAQTAANQMGVNLLQELVKLHGHPKVAAYMRHIQDAAEQKMRTALLRLPEGNHQFTDRLDEGSGISVNISIRHAKDGRGAGATVDFTGTSGVSSGNLNANPAIVASALIYCFRCLIDEDIPLNAGVLAPIDMVLPEDSLLNPRPHSDPARCPAVVGGNVETSQRIVDVIFGALGIAAASQGTMNNLIFGSSGKRAFGYYETIGGGSGATANAQGADAVHTHMTNTRLTDPEVLESRYPVRLLCCGIRSGSGGNGRHSGGHGMIREIRFLEPLEVSLLTNRRTTRPFGAAGGEPGASGRNLLKRHGESEFESLPPACHLEIAPGDVLRIETPGGGGFGARLCRA